MKYFDKAIKLTIEKGGYRNNTLHSRPKISHSGDAVMFDDGKEDGLWEEVKVSQIILDPLFWQALGKALDWGDMEDLLYTLSLPAWQVTAHRYFETVFTSGDTEEFWKQLIEK